MNMSNQVSAVVRSDEGTKVQWGPGGQIRILGGADTTDGCFSVVESLEQPGSSAPLHIHHGEAEAFYIVEGTIELTCGDETVTVSRGDFVYAPKDVPHKYAVVGDSPARILLMFSRAGFETFFVDGGSPIGQPLSGPPDPVALQRLFATYDLEVREPFGA